MFYYIPFTLMLLLLRSSRKETREMVTESFYLILARMQ